jgi:hypothetical protein
MGSDGSLHASFISWPTPSDERYYLKYAKLTNAGWTVHSVTPIEPAAMSAAASPSGFVWPGATSLKLDSFDVPHIAFFNTTSGSTGYLRYAYRKGAEWSVETIDTQGTPGWARLSLVLDPSGNPHIAYLGDWSERELRHAHMQPANTVILLGVGATLAHTGTQSLQTIVEVPGNAVTETVEIVFTERDYTFGFPTGSAFAGQGFQLETYRPDGEHIPDYVFSEPVTITLEYSETDIGVISDESTLELRYWGGRVWENEGITIIEHDLANKRLVTTASRVAWFALFGETNPLYLPLLSND